MRGIYEIVSCNTAQLDIAFTFQWYNDYTWLNKSQMRYIILYTWLCYLGMLKETNNHVYSKLSKASIYFSLRYINNIL